MADYSLAISDIEITRYRLMAESAQQAEAALWQQAGVVPGATVADVGCGPAAMSVVLAQTVGRGGKVVGVERDEASLAAADALVAASGLTNVELRSGTATDTGLAPDSIDVVMCRNVLAHNGPDEQKIVDHLAAICRPGGSVFLVDVDGTATRTLDGEADIDDLNDRYVEFHRRRGNDLMTGLRLAKLLRGAGLDVEAHVGRYNIVTVPPGLRPPPLAAREDMRRDGVVSEQDLARWDAAYARMDAAEVRPTVFVPVFVGLGRKSG